MKKWAPVLEINQTHTLFTCLAFIRGSVCTPEIRVVQGKITELRIFLFASILSEAPGTRGNISPLKDTMRTEQVTESLDEP